MSETTIYHNPKCSKSRATLALLERHGHQPQIVHYLDAPPNLETLANLHKLLGLPVSSMMRTKDADYRSQDLDQADLKTCLQAIASNPALLERPIVTHGERAAIGRPPENVLDLFGESNE